jgi:hypothetical protein
VAQHHPSDDDRRRAAPRRSDGAGDARFVRLRTPQVGDHKARIVAAAIGIGEAAGWPDAFSALPVAKEVFEKRPR